MIDVLTLLFASAIGVISPAGTISDRLVESAVRKALVSAETVQARVDNAPLHQGLQGTVNRLRLAGKGLVPWRSVRIDSLDLETDPIVLQGLRLKLRQPLRFGMHLGMTQEDLNQALRSPEVMKKFAGIQYRGTRYFFTNPTVQFLSERKFKFQVEVQEEGYPDRLAIVAEAEPQVIRGRSIYLKSLRISANGQAAPEQVVRAVTETMVNRLDLRQLEASGILARVVALQVSPNRIDLGAVVQVRSSINSMPKP